MVTSGACEPSISEVVTITVTPAIENNTITAAKTVVCEGTVPVLTGYHCLQVAAEPWFTSGKVA